MLTSRRFLSPLSDFQTPRLDMPPERSGAKKPAASQAHLSGEHEKGGELLMSSDIMDGLELVGRTPPRNRDVEKERPRDGRTEQLYCSLNYQVGAFSVASEFDRRLLEWVAKSQKRSWRVPVDRTRVLE